MEQRRVGRPRKEPVEVNNTANAYIKLTLSMPGYAEISDEIVVKNIKGSLLGSQRRPEVYMEILKEKIR